MIEDQIQINANVVDVKILEELGKKTAIFCIKINGKNGETSLVERVYSDFLRIRDILTYRWPGIYISFLTSKQKNVTL